jgi:hypothetical protein
MPEIQEQYVIDSELQEIQDPSFEEEEAYRLAHLPLTPGELMQALAMRHDYNLETSFNYAKFIIRATSLDLVPETEDEEEPTEADSIENDVE